MGIFIDLTQTAHIGKVLKSHVVMSCQQNIVVIHSHILPIKAM